MAAVDPTDAPGDEVVAAVEVGEIVQVAGLDASEDVGDGACQDNGFQAAAAPPFRPMVPESAAPTTAPACPPNPPRIANMAPA